MSSPSTLTPWYILLFSIGRQTTNANETGNCKSGVYPFDMSRIYVIPPGRITTVFPPLLPEVDPRTTDFTIDYTSDLVVPYSNVSAVGGYGTRITTTRYNLYGRFSIRMKGISAKGIITTFITMSDRGDEIDW
ncbi:hypothetical protein BC829DRAFT_385180 [Chytridium lagenaria]|nr:hypothetical protein BC829DRAFT_385180 [Chytridium lagenaria]